MWHNAINDCLCFKGKMIGFKSDIIHVFNKNEHAVHDSDYFENLSHRTNLLLMGDSLGDLQMANGADNVESKLTIGFLNTRVWTLLIYQNHSRYNKCLTYVFTQSGSCILKN